MTQEIWKDVPDFEGHFQVSNQGRVRTLSRTIERCDGVKLNLRGHYLAVQKRNNGNFINLRVQYAGKKVKSLSATIGRVMLLAFVGVPMPGYEAHSSSDLFSLNLSDWSWQSEEVNKEKIIANGKNICFKNRRVPDEDVRAIRTAKITKPWREKYNRGIVWQIQNGVTYRDVL